MVMLQDNLDFMGLCRIEMSRIIMYISFRREKLAA